MRLHRASALGLALVFGVAATGAGDVPVRLRVELPGSVEAPVPVALILHPVAVDASSDGPTGEISLAVNAPGEAVAALPTGSAWRLEVEADSYWAPSRVLIVAAKGDPGTRVSVRLVSTGFLEGVVRAPASEQVPREISARFEPAPGSSISFPRSTTSCPVVDARFRCELPAGKLDLRLRARGFVSHYRWGETVSPRSRRDVGDLQLVRGASVVGWVEPPSEPGFRFRDCQVELQPSLAGASPGEADRRRRASISARARINDRGFFSLASVAPGSYRLTVLHPDYAPASRAPVDVAPGSETEVRGIELQPFSGLTVSISPPHDPTGRSWGLELLRESVVPGHLDEAAAGVVGEEGGWSNQRLAPGHYVLRVLDSRGSRWHGERIELLPGTGNSPVEITLSLTQLAGRLLYRDEPLAAWLHFGGAHRVPSIAVRSDEDGLFRAVLPSRPEWIVEVVASDPTLHARLNRVAIPAGEEPWLELVVPERWIEGQVVDEAGAPLSAVRVRARHPEQPAIEVLSEADEGAFRIEGLAEGEWLVEARDERQGQRWSSGLHRVELHEGVEAPFQRLVLRSGSEITGQVLSPSGQPIAGALVVGLIEQPTLSLTNTVPEATTTVDGVFEMSAPPGAVAAQLTVMAPGFAVRQVRVDLQDISPLVVPMEAVGGSVVLRFDDSPGSFQKILLFRDRLVALWMYLDRWAIANGVRSGAPGYRLIPLLEPGPYTACFDLGSVEPLLTGRPPPPGDDRCVEGVLSPFGLLELELPFASDR